MKIWHYRHVLRERFKNPFEFRKLRLAVETFPVRQLSYMRLPLALPEQNTNFQKASAP